MKTSILGGPCKALAFGLSLALLAAHTLGGATITVCDEATLRAAIASGGTVVFGCDGVIPLSSNLVVSNKVVLDATGRDVTLSGGNAVRVLRVAPGAVLELRNVKIERGYAEQGAGLYNEGQTIARNCRFATNRAGGAIWIAGGEVALEECKLLNNTGVGGGAVLVAGGRLSAFGCTLDGNQARGPNASSTAPGGSGRGGGLLVEAPATAVLSNCLFSANTATGAEQFRVEYWNGYSLVTVEWSAQEGQGGGVWNAGHLHLVNCTLSGNTALSGSSVFLPVKTGSGGGLYNEGTALALHCTIAANMAAGLNPMFPYPFFQGNGGGYWNSGVLRLQNTLLAANQRSFVARHEGDQNGFGNNEDLGGNLSSDQSCNFTNVASWNDVNPRLGPLADNGGCTGTMVLSDGSPAIDGGVAAGCVPFDQRGVARPQGRVCDIGAYEYAGTNSSLPGTLQFAVGNVSVLESNAMVELQIIRTGGADGQVSARFEQVYSPDTTNGTIVFAAGETNKSITIRFADNATYEGYSRTLSVSLSEPTGGAVLGSRSEIVITIVDDDGKTGTLQFSAPTYEVTEGTWLINLPVLRTGGTDGTVTVSCVAVGGTASGAAIDQDYMLNTVITFNHGQSSNNFQLNIVNDLACESPETIQIVLTNATAGVVIGAQSNAVVTIYDDEVNQPPMFQFSASDFSVSEAEGVIAVTVRRRGGCVGTAAVHYATTDGSAIAGADYETAGGTLQFADGQLTSTILVRVYDDSLFEEVETLTISLFEPANNGVLGSPSTATLKIHSDDRAPALCSQAELQAACTNGGIYQFTNDFTIVISNTLVVTTNVVLDAGEHQVVLQAPSGQNVRLFDVVPGGWLHLRQMTLQGGTAMGVYRSGPGGPGEGGGIRTMTGTLVAENCRFLENKARGAVGGVSTWSGHYSFYHPGGGGSGGAISATNSLVCLTNCQFLGNSAMGGAGAGFGMTASGASLGGAIYASGGQLYASGCAFLTNYVIQDQGQDLGSFAYSGGALRLDGCDVVLDQCLFAQNRAHAGGAISKNRGVLQVIGCAFATNVVYSAIIDGWGGGVVQQTGVTTIANSLFTGNQARAGGAIYQVTGSVAVASCVLQGNVASGAGCASNIAPRGGAFAFASGEAVITRSTVVENKVFGNGYGGAIWNSARLGLQNSTITANRVNAEEPACYILGGGGVANSAEGTVLALFCTIACNQVNVAGNLTPEVAATLGAGCWQAGAGFTFEATILAGNLANTNFAVNASGAFIDATHNLSSDATPAWIAPMSRNNIDPMLGPLASNGGWTPTMALPFNSPAVDGAGDRYLPTDQRGFPRPSGGACDIGAYEYHTGGSYLTMGRNSSGALCLTVTGKPAQAFTVQESTDLKTWSNVATGAVSTSGWCELPIQQNKGAAQRFMRLVMP